MDACLISSENEETRGFPVPTIEPDYPHGVMFQAELVSDSEPFLFNYLGSTSQHNETIFVFSAGPAPASNYYGPTDGQVITVSNARSFMHDHQQFEEDFEDDPDTLEAMRESFECSTRAFDQFYRVFFTIMGFEKPTSIRLIVYGDAETPVFAKTILSTTPMIEWREELFPFLMATALDDDYCDDDETGCIEFDGINTGLKTFKGVALVLTTSHHAPPGTSGSYYRFKHIIDNMFFGDIVQQSTWYTPISDAATYHHMISRGLRASGLNNNQVDLPIGRFETLLERRMANQGVTNKGRVWSCGGRLPIARPLSQRIYPAFWKSTVSRNPSLLSLYQIIHQKDGFDVEECYVLLKHVFDSLDVKRKAIKLPSRKPKFQAHLRGFALKQAMGLPYTTWTPLRVYKFKKRDTLTCARSNKDAFQDYSLPKFNTTTVLYWPFFRLILSKWRDGSSLAHKKWPSKLRKFMRSPTPDLAMAHHFTHILHAIRICWNEGSRKQYNDLCRVACMRSTCVHWHDE